MRVDTFLRKEKDGSLYQGGSVGDVEQKLDKTLGLHVRNLMQKRTLGKELAERVRGAFEEKLGEAHVDKLPGGLADKSEPKDFPPKQLHKGVKVEMEHVDRSALAKEIAMDHLKEFPQYYTALARMEKKLEKEGGVLQDVGRVLTTPIPGTKDWLIRGADPALKRTKDLAVKVRRAAGTRTTNNVTTLGKGYEKYLPKMAGTGAWENKLPWYTTAAAGTGGASLGQKLTPQKYKGLGTVAGALLGTGLGLEVGTPIGRTIDRRKTAGSQQPMQRMFGEGASRGIQHYTEMEPDKGKPATARVRQGDVPSRDEHPTYVGVTSQNSPSVRALDLAPKVAAKMGRLLNRDQFPTLEEGPERDQALVHSRGKSSYQHAGADQPTTEFNPNWRAK